MKKGNLSMEMVGTFIFVITVMVVSVLTMLLIGVFNEGWQDLDVVDTNTKTETQEYVNLTNSVLDGAIIFYFIILWLGTLVSSYFLDNSPIYFALFVVVGILTFIIGMPLANLAMALNTGALTEYFDKLPMTFYIIQNMAVFMVIYLATTGFALYSKFNRGEF